MEMVNLKKLKVYRFVTWVADNFRPVDRDQFRGSYLLMIKDLSNLQNGLGSTFINMISMIVLPIVFSSLVVGIANMGDIKKLGRIGLKTLIYFEVLSTIAFIVGMLVSNLSQIGYMLDLSKLSQVDISTYVKTAKQASHSGLGSILMSIVPSNFFDALATGQDATSDLFLLFIWVRDRGNW